MNDTADSARPRHRARDEEACRRNDEARERERAEIIRRNQEEPDRSCFLARLTGPDGVLRQYVELADHELIVSRLMSAWQRAWDMRTLASLRPEGQQGTISRDILSRGLAPGLPDNAEVIDGRVFVRFFEDGRHYVREYVVARDTWHDVTTDRTADEYTRLRVYGRKHG